MNIEQPTPPKWLRRLDRTSNIERWMGKDEETEELIKIFVTSIKTAEKKPRQDNAICHLEDAICRDLTCAICHILRPLHNPSIVIASEAKQSHNTLISHEIAASLCSSQWPKLGESGGYAKVSSCIFFKGMSYGTIIGVVECSVLGVCFFIRCSTFDPAFVATSAE